jgi:hypothetical protein
MRLSRQILSAGAPPTLMSQDWARVNCGAGSGLASQFLKVSDKSDAYIGLSDLAEIVGIHAQIQIRLELQSPADIELKIENDFAFRRKREALEEDARSDGQAAGRFLIKPEKPKAGLEHVSSQGVAPESFLQQLGPIRKQRREAVEVMSVSKQVLANVVFKLQREVRKIWELGRLRLRLTLNRSR